MIAALLALLVPVLGWIARSVIVGMVLRLLLGLGIGLATYKLAVQPFIDYVRDVAGGVSADLVDWCGVVRLDVAITMLCSAYAVRAAVSAVHMVKKS